MGGERISMKQSWLTPLSLSHPPHDYLHPQCLSPSPGGQTSGLRGPCEGQGRAGPKLVSGKFGSFLSRVGRKRCALGAAGVAYTHTDTGHVDTQLDT